MRSSLGLAFGPAGRLGLFLFLALCSAPAIHCDHTTLECYASGGAVAFLIVSALLQSWMLSCAPEYRGTVVASLETQKIKTDSTPDVFPQIYQRDEGTHLHLGVLIPGFASRDTCTMYAMRHRPGAPPRAPLRRRPETHPLRPAAAAAAAASSSESRAGPPTARRSRLWATSRTSRPRTRRWTAPTRWRARLAPSSAMCSWRRPST
jgi:hypothetical protein